MASDQTNNQASLQSLPDEVLLNIFIYLPLSDRISLCSINQHFSNLFKDSSLMRCISASHDWNLDTDAIIQVIKHSPQDVHHLDLAHCYWFQTKNIAKCAMKCQNLIKLDIRGCSVTPRDLDKILGVTTSLKHLAVTDAGVRIIQNGESTKQRYRMSDKACETLQGLTEINITMESKCTSELYVLPLCKNATSLSLLCHPRYGNCCCILSELNISHVTNIRIDPMIAFHHIHLSLELDNALNRHPKLNKFLLPITDLLTLTTVENSSRPEQIWAQSYSLVLSRHCSMAADVIKLPSRLQCFHLDCYPPSMYEDKYMSAILDQLTPRVTCLQLPLQLIERKTDQKQLHSHWMTQFHSLCSHVKHLDVTGSLCHKLSDEKTKTVLENCANEAWKGIVENVTKALTSLAVPPCFVLDDQSCLQHKSHKLKGKRPNNIDSKFEGYGKRQRVGESTAMPGSGSSSQSLGQESVGRLEQCVQSCPNMTKFCLMPLNLPGGVGIVSQWRQKVNVHTSKEWMGCALEDLVKDQHLSCISKWKHLTSLTLTWLPGIRHGKCLIEITKRCSRLQFLSLAYIGLHGGCSYHLALCEALTYAKNLQDLRVEQPYMLVNQALCGALQHCSELTRLCLLTVKSCQFSHDGILNVFRECRRLCVLHLLTDGSKAACIGLSKALNSRYKKERPALNVFISTDLQKFDKLNSVPYVHIKELTTLKFHAGEVPIGWNGLSPV